MSTLVGKGLVRGSLIHLVEEGEARTLCGRAHGVNTRYIKPGGLYTVPPEAATCKRCIALASDEVTPSPAVTILREFVMTLPHDHPDRLGVLRAIEILRGASL